MKHFASPDFWSCYRRLPKAIQRLADTSYGLLKADLWHPSLRFKKIGKYRAVRVGLHYRALGVDMEEGVLWFWIGSHSDYDKLVSLHYPPSVAKPIRGKLSRSNFSRKPGRFDSEVT